MKRCVSWKIAKYKSEFRLERLYRKGCSKKSSRLLTSCAPWRTSWNFCFFQQWRTTRTSRNSCDNVLRHTVVCCRSFGPKVHVTMIPCGHTYTNSPRGVKHSLSVPPIGKFKSGLRPCLLKSNITTFRCDRCWFLSLVRQRRRRFPEMLDRAQSIFRRLFCCTV